MSGACGATDERSFISLFISLNVCSVCVCVFCMGFVRCAVQVAVSICLRMAYGCVTCGSGGDDAVNTRTRFNYAHATQPDTRANTLAVYLRFHDAIGEVFSKR